MGLTKNFYTLEQIRKDDLLEDAKIVKVNVELIRHTARAILVYAKIVMVKVRPWIPKSQIVEPDPIALNMVQSGDELELIIPLWLAKSKSLTYKEIHYESKTIR